MDRIPRLTTSQKLSYGVGHILNDLCAAMWFTYLLVYLQYVLQVERSTAGLLLLLGQVTDALATPLVGLASDSGCGGPMCSLSSCCHSYGRRKMWHAFGSVLVVLSFPFIFIRCASCLVNFEFYIALISVMICIFQFGWASTQVSHLALIPDICSTEEDRDELNIIRYFFDVLCEILVYIIAWGVFQGDYSPYSSAIDPSDNKNFTVVTISILVVGALFTIIFHVFTDEPPPVVIRSSKSSEEVQKRRIPSDDKKDSKHLPRVSSDEQEIVPSEATGGARPKTTKLKRSSQEAHVKRRVGSKSLEKGGTTLDEAANEGTSGKSLRDVNTGELSKKNEVKDGSDGSSIASISTLAELEMKRGSPEMEKRLNYDADDEMFPEDRVVHTWKDWFYEPQFYQMSTLYSFARLIANMLLVYTPVYLQETGHSTETIALVPLVISLAGVGATVGLKVFRKCLGKKGSVLLAVFLGLGACGIMGFSGLSVQLPSNTDATDILNARAQIPQWLIYLIASMLGFSGSMLMVLSLAFTADMIGRNRESSAFVYGVMSMGDKIMNGLAVVGVQEGARVSCETGRPCGWYFQYLISMGMACALLVCGALGVTLFITRLGYTRKMRRAREERGMLGIGSYSPLTSSDSSELLIPTPSQMTYGTIAACTSDNTVV